MKTIEIRRHSIRSGGADHLNQTGITFARLTGENLGPFDYVATSELPRTLETAIAMGFAVDEQYHLLNTYGLEVEKEAPWPLSYAEYAPILQESGAAAKYGKKLVKLYAKLMDHLSEGRSALVISHGGVVELSVAACLPNFDFSNWGGSVGYCEGAKLFWEDGFVGAEEMRIAQ